MLNVRCSSLQRALAALVCIAVGQSLLVWTVDSLSVQPAGSGAASSMAGPVKAVSQITGRHDLALEGAKTRSASLTPLALVAVRCGGQLLHSDSLDYAEQSNRPRIALLNVRRGRAPPPRV